MYEKMAQVLTKVFYASRLHEEVTEDLVKVITDVREKAKKRSPIILDRIKEILTDGNYKCNAGDILDQSNKKEVILTGRIKTLPSAMYNLLATKNGKPQNLNDMIGLMIVCEDDLTCYDIQRLLVGRLVADGDTIIEIKDMISKPKPNGYQAIHVNVYDGVELLFEIQIKSYKMFSFAQTGDRRHNVYKKRLDYSALDEQETILFESMREEYWL